MPERGLRSKTARSRCTAVQFKLREWTCCSFPGVLTPGNERRSESWSAATAIGRIERLARCHWPMEGRRDARRPDVPASRSPSFRAQSAPTLHWPFPAPRRSYRACWLLTLGRDCGSVCVWTYACGDIFKLTTFLYKVVLGVPLALHAELSPLTACCDFRLRIIRLCRMSVAWSLATVITFNWNLILDFEFTVYF